MEIYGSDIRGGVLHEKGSLNGRSLPSSHYRSEYVVHSLRAYPLLKD
jgi:hypothetical protein